MGSNMQTPSDSESSSLRTNPSSCTSMSELASRPRSPAPVQDAGTQLAPPIRNICCVGAGYVGGPTAAMIAMQNPQIRVTVVDRDAARIRRWMSQHPPIHEPGLRDVLRVARDGLHATDEQPAREPNLFFSTEVGACIAQADLIFLSVNTPTKLSGIGAGSATDLFALELAAQSVAENARPGAIIVEKSTVLCRTAKRMRDICTLYRPGVDFEILSNPEFLAEGTAIRDLLSPDRVLIGSSQTAGGRAAAQALANVYAGWIPCPQILTVHIWSAELAKLAANAMLAQRVSSINAISAVCERTGANVDEVARSIGCDARLGPRFLQAGLGFGGSCFKKDLLSLVYLARALGLPEVADYWEHVVRLNEYQRTRFVARVVADLNGTLVGKKLALLGYAFKNNTSDTRESPAVEVVRQVLADRPREVAIFDPRCNPADVRAELRRLGAQTGERFLAPDGPIEVYDDAYRACEGACAALILTEWEQFRYPPRRNPSAREEFVELVSPRAPVGPEGRNGAQVDKHGLEARYKPEPSCQEDCLDCARGEEGATRAAENVDWVRVAEVMAKPRWVFDGRGLVDVKAMEQLGFCVEAIGRAGSRSPLEDSVNEWGADGSGQTCIERSESTSFTATWHYSSNPSKVHSYPNIGLLSPQLPFHISNLGSLNVTVAWSMSAAQNYSSSGSNQDAGDSGSATQADPTGIDASALDKLNVSTNVAFDMFLDSDPANAVDTTAAKYEVMIWLGAFGSAAPFGAGDKHDASIIVKGMNYTLSEASNRAGQRVYTWLAESNVTSITEPANFAPLLASLLNSSKLPQDVQLGTLQFGSETFHATQGRVNFTASEWNFNVTQKQTSESSTIWRDHKTAWLTVAGLFVSLLL